MSITLVAVVNKARHQTGATCQVCSMQFASTRNIYTAVAARLVQDDLPCWKKYSGNYFIKFSIPYIPIPVYNL